MPKKECIALILAGGQGARLGTLTRKLAKPAIPFGGKYRIIDFTLSNCYNSRLDTIGILTQYRPFALQCHIGTGTPWDLDNINGKVYILPPFQTDKGGEWYKGTANAILQNTDFIEQYDPQYVLVLSGDHIYKMNYSLMLDYHKSKQAEATIAVIEVPWSDASRFGIMNSGKDGRIEEFEEKPKKPKNNLASMGIYVFNWQLLKQYLEEDAVDPGSKYDFGKNIIPKMLGDGRQMFAYSFQGYWKDVGTIESLWQANMDLLGDAPPLDLSDAAWRIFCVNPIEPPHYVTGSGNVKQSIVSGGCQIYGEVDHSVVCSGAFIGEGAVIKESVILPNAKIGRFAQISKTIIGENVVVGAGSQIGWRDLSLTKPEDLLPITVIGENTMIRPDSRICRSVLISAENHLKPWTTTTPLTGTSYMEMETANPQG